MTVALIAAIASRTKLRINNQFINRFSRIILLSSGIAIPPAQTPQLNGAFPVRGNTRRSPSVAQGENTQFGLLIVSCRVSLEERYSGDDSGAACAPACTALGASTAFSPSGTEALGIVVLSISMPLGE
ncbi:MAG: hypothetical protein ACRDJE_23985, partial [Dehalococcoidia bacterium]